MASQKIYTVPHARKREKKTDYKKRLSLLKARKSRFVIRRSLKYITVQLVDFLPKGDKVNFTVSTKELKKYGWEHSTSNLPAAYLAGVLAGKKAKDKKVNTGVVDFGLESVVKGSRLYAALKGLIDAGIEIPYSDDVLPSEDRLNGKHIKEGLDKDIKQVKDKVLA
ncbi:MAG: 50S ribosomal protein L18 [Nanobdellota archaeon]